MFIITAVEKEPQKKKIEKELKEDSDEDELNDLKITRKQKYWKIPLRINLMMNPMWLNRRILKNTIENKLDDESDVIGQKNLELD